MAPASNPVIPCRYLGAVFEFLHSDLGYRTRGDVLQVTLTAAANVRLLDFHNFSQYQNGMSHQYYGGLAMQTPVRIEIPHSGHWYAVVDLQGLSGPVNAGFQVIDGSALRPLPPIPPSVPARERRSTITDVLDNASELADAGEDQDFDVFISHATEDKMTVAGPLAHALQERDVRVWYDEFELRIGDSLRRSIDNGISRSRFGLVVLSKPFFDKDWPQYELDGLVTRAHSDKQVLLPIWHEISKDEVVTRSPSLADRVALRTSDHGIEEIADQIASVITGRR